MSFPLDLTVTGKPTPRTTERPGSTRRSQTRRPLSANRSRNTTSNIFETNDGIDKSKSRPRVQSAKVRSMTKQENESLPLGSSGRVSSTMAI